MYVCSCNGITDRDIRAAAANGISSLAELTRETGCAGDCGSCAGMASEILTTAVGRRVFALPLPLAVAA